MNNNNIKVFESLHQKISLLTFENEKLEKQMRAVRKTNIEYIHQISKAKTTIKQLKDAARPSVEIEQLQVRLQICEYQNKKLNQTMDRVRKTNFNYIGQITTKNQQIQQLNDEIEKKDLEIIILHEELKKCVCKQHAQIVSELKEQLKTAQLKNDVSQIDVIESKNDQIVVISQIAIAEPLNDGVNKKLQSPKIINEEFKSQSESISI